MAVGRRPRGVYASGAIAEAREARHRAEAQACFANDRLLDKVLADVQSGQTLGVRFTPTLFINEENYANPGTADAISAILRQVGR